MSIDRNSSHISNQLSEDPIVSENSDFNPLPSGRSTNPIPGGLIDLTLKNQVKSCLASQDCGSLSNKKSIKLKTDKPR